MNDTDESKSERTLITPSLPVDSTLADPVVSVYSELIIGEPEEVSPHRLSNVFSTFLQKAILQLKAISSDERIDQQIRALKDAESALAQLSAFSDVSTFQKLNLTIPHEMLVIAREAEKTRASVAGVRLYDIGYLEFRRCLHDLIETRSRFEQYLVRSNEQ